MDSKFRCVFEDFAEEKPKSPDFNPALSRVDVNEKNTTTSNQDSSDKDKTNDGGSNKPNTTAGNGTSENSDSKIKNLAEENQRLLEEVQKLRTKVETSPGRISGSIAVNAQQQNTLNTLLVVIVGIIALLVGLFLGMSRSS